MSDDVDTQPDLNRPGFGGRPPIFATPEDMQEQIVGYFGGGMKKRQITIGKGKDRMVIDVPVPTITGLVLYLGFDSRQSFYDYEKKPEFSYTIKKARTFIENEYEEILATTGSPGAIFALKNFGWHDKTEIEHSGSLNETRAKIKDFLNDPDNSDDAPTSDPAPAIGNPEPSAATEPEATEEVAPAPTDIS